MAKPRKKWAVTFKVSRTVTVRATTAAEAEALVCKKVFDADHSLKRKEITDTTVLWIDETGLGHLEGCTGTHCRHYDCEVEDIDYRWYCSQCDVDAQ